MRDAIQSVMDLQPAWTSVSTEEMQLRGLYIRGDMVEWLRDRGPTLAAAAGLPNDDFLVEGRDHTGRMSQIPWVRFASRSRSPSATDGWYVAYLFSADGHRLYLSINQGTQIWDGIQYRDRSAEQIGGRVSWARARLEAEAYVDGWNEAIDLAGTTSKGPAYEGGNVLCRVYERSNLPTVATLESDALLAAGMLRTLYEEESRGWIPGDQSPEERMADEAAADGAGRPRRSTAGFRTNTVERGLIEMHAVNEATKHYQSLGGDVKYVGNKRPFDLEVQLDGTKLAVEVKGTVTSGNEVILTRGEVEHHAKVHPANALVVVSGIWLDRSTDPPSVSGGALHETRPWSIDQANLKVIAYVYTRDSTN